MTTTTTKHFAVGLAVQIKKGALPVGWPEGDAFQDGPFVYETYREVTEVASAEEGLPFGSFEVAGWYWAPDDITTQV